MRKLSKVGLALSMIALAAVMSMSLVVADESELNGNLSGELSTTVQAEASDSNDGEIPTEQVIGVETGGTVRDGNIDADRDIADRRTRQASRGSAAATERGEKWWWWGSSGGSHGGDHDDDDDDNSSDDHSGDDDGHGESPTGGGKDGES
jgi:hypothetical protein